MVGTENNACWFSLLAHILFPQRTTQYAYTISLLGLILGGTPLPLPLPLIDLASFPRQKACDSPRCGRASLSFVCTAQRDSGVVSPTSV
jgi:hypothetical protein